MDFHVMAKAQRLKPCEYVAVRMDIPEPVVRQPEHYAIAGDTTRRDDTSGHIFRAVRPWC